MAKRCNVCKKTYPDNLKSCPHCEKAAEAEEADVLDEAVEVEESPSGTGKSGKLPPKKPAQPKPTMIAGDEIDILAEEVADEAVEEAPPKAKPTGSKPDISADPKKTHLAGKTGQPTKLSSKTPAPTMLAPADADADILDAEVDEDSAPVFPPKKPAGKGSDVDLAVADEVLVEGASEINLGDAQGGKGDRPSGLDLIAEAVESGVDLNKDKKRAAPKEPAGVEDEAADMLADESSAVDLGSTADEALNPFAGQDSEKAASSKRRSGKATDEAAEEAAADEEVAEAEGAEEAEAAEEAEEEEAHVGPGGGGAATATAPPRQKSRSHLFAGIGIGLLAGVVGVGALAGFTDVIDNAVGKKKPEAPDTKIKERQLSDAVKTAEGAQKQVQELQTQLDAEKKKVKADPGVQNALDAAKAEAKQKADALKEATKAVESIQSSLKEAGYPADKDVSEQVKKLAKDAGADKALLDDVSKALKVQKDKLAAAVKKLDADKTMADGKLAKARERLEAAVDKDRLMGKELDQGIEMLVADKKMVETDRARLDGIVKTVRDKLKEGRFLTGDASKDAAVLAGLDKALKQAISPLVTAMAEVTGAVTDATSGLPDLVNRVYDLTTPVQREAQLGYYKMREPLVHTPEKMLDNWIPLLSDMDRKDAAELAKKASIDANWVKKQALQATPADKAKADYILGLAQRGQLNYVEAKKLLEVVAAGPEMPNDPPFKKQARQVIWEMTDPLAYYVRYAHLAAQDKRDRMLTELAAGVKATTGAQKGSLLALSGLVRLDKARAAGRKLDPKMADLVQAEADGKAAIAAGAMEEGNYALGRRAELLGDLDAALKHYRVAAQLKGRKDLASAYRLALARVLLQVNTPAPEEKKAPKAKSEKTEANAGDRHDFRAAHLSRRALLKQALTTREKGTLTPATMLLVLNMVMLTADDDEPDAPKNIAQIDEAIKLAHDAIELGDPNGYLILGIALTQKDQWTKGLSEYIVGLEKLYPGPAAQGLRQIFDEHPLFRIPDSARPPQPLQAEKHYAAGLTYYWNGKYEQAEEEFKEAVRFFEKDARYFYYLGLSQLMQKPSKAGAATESFRLGKRLEDQGNPDKEEVNHALERVQGEPRKVLGRLRQKP
jgi:tetratricopeptide (TPR) repeat protein